MSSPARICPQCGATVETGESFCPSCSEYLPWDAPDVVAPPATPAAATPSAPSAPSVTAAVPAPVRPVVPPARPAGPAPPSPPPAATSEPSAVLPRAPLPRPREQPAGAEPVAAPTPAPGDAICGVCGAGSPPGRAFCRSCGAPLTPSATPATTTSAGPRAGERRAVRRRRFPTSAVLVVALIGLLAAVGWVARDDIRSFVGTVIDRTSTLTPISPDWAATSEASDHPAGLLGDGLVDTSWVAGAAGLPDPAVPDARLRLTATLTDPMRVAYLQIRTGASDAQDRFLAQGRATAFDLEIERSDGVVVKQRIDLADSTANQQFAIGVDDVVAITLIVTDAELPDGDSAAAVAEIELTGR